MQCHEAEIFNIGMPRNSKIYITVRIIIYIDQSGAGSDEFL